MLDYGFRSSGSVKSICSQDCLSSCIPAFPLSCAALPLILPISDRMVNQVQLVRCRASECIRWHEVIGSLDANAHLRRVSWLASDLSLRSAPHAAVEDPAAGLKCRVSSWYGASSASAVSMHVLAFRLRVARGGGNLSRFA